MNHSPVIGWHHWGLPLGMAGARGERILGTGRNHCLEYNITIRQVSYLRLFFLHAQLHWVHKKFKPYKSYLKREVYFQSSWALFFVFIYAVEIQYLRAGRISCLFELSMKNLSLLYNH